MCHCTLVYIRAYGASSGLYLGNSMTVPEDHTNLGGGQTLLGQLEDLVLNLVGGELEPLWD